MKLPALLGLLLALATEACAVIFQSGSVATPLIELYTSEGCSSCPPAERWLSSLKTDPGLWKKFVPVSFHVNYWDYLGWKDPFAQVGFTERQHAYASAWNARSVYTPAFVRQGREWRPDSSALAPASPGVLTVEREPDGSGSVRFEPSASGHAGKFVVTVALLGCGASTDVRAGENAGRTLSHDFIALHLATVPLVAGPGGSFTGIFGAPPRALPVVPRRAFAAWVSASDDQSPIQSVGGWLP